MDTVNDVGKTRKFILWVEDFGKTDVYEEDEEDSRDPIENKEPDPGVGSEYSQNHEEVDSIGDDMPYFGFPDYLKKRIDIIRDPTDLPGKMGSEGKNYELIVLDKNFTKDCITTNKEKIRDFVESLRKANINCDDFLIDPKNVTTDASLQIDDIKDVEKWDEKEDENKDKDKEKEKDVLSDLGHYLSSYLLVSQKVPVDQIVFLTGNAEEKNEKGIISIKEYDKYNGMPNDPFTKFIKKKFPESELSPGSVLNQARNLFYRWKAITNGTIPDESALVRLCYNGKLCPEDNKAIIARIEDALYSVNVSNASQAFDMILAAVAFPFGERIVYMYESDNKWDEALCKTMKRIRNPYCHRHGEICVDESDFFVLFVAGMRAIFDHKEGFEELEEERWFINSLKNSVHVNGSDQKRFNQKDSFKKWYFQCLNNSKNSNLIADMDTLLDKAREIYPISDVVHMLFMKSLDAIISFEYEPNNADIMCKIKLEIKNHRKGNPKSKKIIANYAELYSKNEKDDSRSEGRLSLYL